MPWIVIGGIAVIATDIDATVRGIDIDATVRGIDATVRGDRADRREAIGLTGAAVGPRSMLVRHVDDEEVQRGVGDR